MTSPIRGRGTGRRRKKKKEEGRRRRRKKKKEEEKEFFCPSRSDSYTSIYDILGGNSVSQIIRLSTLSFYYFPPP